jgi:hypothetical protein
MTDETPHGFFADPVDDDGNVIAHVTHMRVTSTNFGEIPMTKIPHSEICAEDMPRFRVPDGDEA